MPAKPPVHYQRRSRRSTEEDAAALDGDDNKFHESASGSGNLALEVDDIGDSEVHEQVQHSDILDVGFGSDYSSACGLPYIVKRLVRGQQQQEG